MALLAVHDLFKAYGPSVILAGASFSVTERERVGLVGSNGCGKSTLARILVGAEEPDSGVRMLQRGASVAFLAQEPALDPELTPRQIILGGLEDWSRAARRHDELSHALERGDGLQEELLRLQAEAASEVERLGGWDPAHRADAVMQKLGVLYPDRAAGTLSGGEKRRVALARILVSRPALAVLDEPTNHLDAETIEWLEGYLVNEYEGALVLITHDRWVLDRVVERTIELERGLVYSYDGGWEDYLIAKAERQELAARTESNRQNLLRTELEWLSRQPKARTGKQKARIQRAETAVSAARPSVGRDVKLELHGVEVGSSVLALEEVSIDIGERRLVEALTLHVGKGQRIGVVGRNGTGKTTLLRCLLGELAPAAGRVARGARVKFAYFDQGRTTLDDAASVAQNVAGDADVVRFGDKPVTVYSYLERFLFHGDRIRQPVGSLSGGERARVALAKMLLEPANLILMDEPTNDLDVATLGALETMLVEMRATAIVVTHDRYFLDRVATNILAFEGDGKVTLYPGGYSTFQRLRTERRELLLASAAEEEKDARRRSAPPQGATGTKPTAERKKGLTWAEQRELKRVEAEIAEREARVGELEAILGDPTTYAERGGEVAALVSERQEQGERLTALMERWEALETLRVG